MQSYSKFKSIGFTLLIVTPLLFWADYWQSVRNVMNRCAHTVFNRPSLFIHRLALALVLSIPTLAAGDYWTTPFKADACVAPGYRQHSAQLMGIVGSWEAACTAKPADINGQHFDQPTRCVKNNGMWGEFDVRDTTCDPTWASITSGTCREKGVRQHSGRLTNIVGSWEAACAKMPATVAGQYFDHPSRCVINNGMWGEFDVLDETCPHWGKFKKDLCTDVGKRQHSSILADIAPGTDWKTACYAQGAVIEGQAFDAPARCSENGGAMWGEFDVDDSSCIPHWGHFKPASCCVKLGVKRYSAQLIDIPTGVTWEHACAVMPATVNGQYFPTPSACTNQGIDGMFGYFDANDNSCFASWGNTTSQCFSKGVRRFSAYIVAECGIDRSAACAVTPQSIRGVNFPSPDSCSSPNAGVALGTFNVPDKCCFPDGLDIPSCAPPAQVPRLVATDGLKIWPTDKTAYATARKFQLDVEHGWRNKISVYADGALVLDVDPGEPTHSTQLVETVSEDQSNLKTVSRVTVFPPASGFIEGKRIVLGISEESINPKYIGTSSQRALFETPFASVTKPCVVDVTAPATVNYFDPFSVSWAAAACKQYDFLASGNVFEHRIFDELSGNADRTVSDVAVYNIVIVGASGVNASGTSASKQKVVVAICQGTPNNSPVAFSFAVQGGQQCTTITQYACNEDQAKKIVELTKPPPDWEVKPGVCQ